MVKPSHPRGLALFRRWYADTEGMNLNLTADPMADLLNREIARRESLPPFVNNNAIPMAFLDVKDGVARVCCYHAEAIEDQRVASKEATDWCAAQGLRVTHTLCAACAPRELAALRSLATAS